MEILYFSDRGNNIMFNLNKNVQQRDEIIFGKYEPSSYMGGICRFEKLNLATLKQLVEHNFLCLDERQNCCPSVEEILHFMEKYPDYTTHGYAVSIERRDYRVSLEGVEKNSSASSKQEKSDFIKLFKYADEIYTKDKMFCWFD